MLAWNFLLRYHKVTYLKCIKCFGYFNFFIYLLNLDLWFWIGQGGRIRWISSHDSGSCHSVLSSSRNPDGQPSLQQCYWHLVCRLYLCRITWAKNIVSGTESHSAGIIKFPFKNLLHNFVESITDAFWISNFLLFCLVYTQAKKKQKKTQPTTLKHWNDRF